MQPKLRYGFVGCFNQRNHKKSKKMKKILSLLLLIAVFSSCSEYQKALKSEDVAVKFEMATKLYDAGKYTKAIRIFEQINSTNV